MYTHSVVRILKRGEPTTYADVDEPGDTVLSERSQAQRDKHRVTSLVWGTRGRAVAARGGGGGGGVGSAGWVSSGDPVAARSVTRGVRSVLPTQTRTKGHGQQREW